MNHLISRIQVAAATQRERHRQVRQNSKKLLASMEEAEKMMNRYGAARELLLATSEALRSSSHGFFERVVSSACQLVFEDPSMQFRINSVQNAKTGLGARYELQWTSNNHLVSEDPMYARGGSAIDVCSTALQLAYLHVYQPKKRQIFFTDEPGKNLDSHRRTLYGEWLREVSRELGFQLIVITHDPEIKEICDRHLHLTPSKDGVVVTIKDRT